MIYNVLLEYASQGSLADLIKRSRGSGLPELDVRRYTKCILKGIDYIHNNGYVHCDLKPDNVLLVSDENSESFVPKIADFGLAKRSAKSNRMKFDPNIGGTALYMAPETVIDGVREPPCDIWALGCIVYEMLTGNKAWNPKPDMSNDDILEKISDRCELPKIPPNISEEGKGFLKGCLVRNPVFRFTAGMLLIHPFVSGIPDKIGESLNEERAADDDDHELCSASSFTSEEGFTYPFLSRRLEDGVNIDRRMFNKNLVEFPKQGLKVL
ncbi:mitogen-activated protein kinase kinase kinase 21 [Euphorbia peplus]|nr:mitogen-activated protein kinase kinase kinase 21 [Euphorbia peplus]